MRILGIDPGYAIVGWGVIDIDKHRSINLVDYGIIKTDKDIDIPSRLSEIYSDMTGIIDQYQPDYAGIETLLFQKNAKTVMKVSEARGVIMLSIYNKQIPVFQVTPLQVKSSISGYGRAPKEQVQENVRIICNLKEIPKPDDAADAIAVGICAFDMNYNSIIIGS